MEELVSIIMPNYNGGKYIKCSIESVLLQEYKNWELIIIDDNSNDDSMKIIEQYKKIDNRIKIIKLNKNIGPAEARNYGIRKAEGKYIAFIDSDDIWLSEKLKYQIPFMESNENIIISFTAFKIINDNNIIRDRKIYYKNAIKYKELLKYDYIPMSTAIYKIINNKKYYFVKYEFINRYKKLFINTKIVGQEDYVLWLDILKYSNKYAIGQDKILGYYRIHDKQISRNKYRAAIAHWLILRKYEQLSIAYSIYNYIYYILYGVRKYIKIK